MTPAQLAQWQAQQRRFAAARAAAAPAKNPQPQVVRVPLSPGPARAEQRQRRAPESRTLRAQTGRVEVKPEAVPVSPLLVKYRAADDPHELAMAAPPKVFMGRCMGCGGGTNENEDGEQHRLCTGCRKKKSLRALDGVRDDRAVGLALVTAEAQPLRQFQKQCAAVDALSGSRCKLLAPHPKHPHANERGQFLQELQPGEVSRREAAVVTAALASRGDNSAQLEGARSGDLAVRKKSLRKLCPKCGQRKNGNAGLCWNCRQEPPASEPPPLLVTMESGEVSLRDPGSPAAPPEWRENPEAYVE